MEFLRFFNESIYWWASGVGISIPSFPAKRVLTSDHVSLSGDTHPTIMVGSGVYGLFFFFFLIFGLIGFWKGGATTASLHGYFSVQKR